MSENISGIEREIEHSLSFHREGVGLLVSSRLLRERSMGQIDLARLRKDKLGWIIEIAEVKSSQVGHEQMIRGQRARLIAAQSFLSSLLGKRSRLLNL